MSQGPGGSRRGLPPDQGVRGSERGASRQGTEDVRQSSQRRGGQPPPEGPERHRLPAAATVVSRRGGGGGPPVPAPLRDPRVPERVRPARRPQCPARRLAGGSVRLLRALAAQPPLDRLRDRRRGGEG